MYRTGDGQTFDTMLAATEHCTYVYLTTGVILALEGPL